MSGLVAGTVLLGASAAQAQDAKCKLDIWSNIQMTREGDKYFVPVKLNGTPQKFVLDTGGYITQVNRAVAETLKLPIRQNGQALIDATGKVSRDAASVHEFMLGNLRGNDVVLHVSTTESFDGLLALDQMIAMDADMDFGKNTLRFFSPDHCPGEVVYWTSPANAAVLPFTMDGFHIRVPVTLDGHAMYAMIDTGAPGTALDLDEGHRAFDLTMGDSDTPEAGILNGDATLKIYSHRFKSLELGSLSVTNPQMYLIPNSVGRNLDRQPVGGGRIKTEKDLISHPELIIGMNVLSKLHVYFAFKERKMYITPLPVAATAPATPEPAKP